MNLIPGLRAQASCGGKDSLEFGFVARVQTDRLNTTHMTTNSSKKVFGCMDAEYRSADDPSGVTGRRVTT